jgi:NitT/TauT family transport system substrate-binding protein
MTIAAISIILVVLFVVAGWYLTGPGKNPTGPAEHITVGTAPAELAGLIYIADDQGFFRKNGLDVTVKNYNSAISAVAGMEQGDADISVSTEYPIVAGVLSSQNVSVIGSIDKYQTSYLAGLRDRGIYNNSDIAGKKIGLSRGGSISEFYLGRFLVLNDMSIKDVTLVETSQSQVVGALANRSIDAAIIWNIDPGTIRDRFGSNAVIWPVQGGQPTFGVLAARNSWVSGHAGPVAKFLRSIDEAEQYATAHPVEAKAIVRHRLNATDAHLAAVWPDHTFSLTLDQSLVTAMEDEGRWVMANNKTNATVLPDFREYISTKGVETVKPSSVYIY